MLCTVSGYYFSALSSSCDQFLRCKSDIEEKMAIINEVLEFLKTLILFTNHDTLKVSKVSLTNIEVYLQNAKEKIDFLQFETQLQQEEVKQTSHSEPVSVQNNETGSHKYQDNIVEVHSDPVPNKAAVVHADAETQSALPKPIIRPWEQLVHNKHKTGLGYVKDLSFHIPDYSKPIQFQSAGFIHDSSSAPHDSSPLAVQDFTPLPQQKQQIVKC